MMHKPVSFVLRAVKSNYSKLRQIILSDIGQSGASTNDVATWNGTNWVPDNTIVASTIAATTGRFTGMNGAPVDVNGTDGDLYFRLDGGALTTIYQRRAGAWVGIV